MRNVVLIVLDTVRKDFFDENAHRLQERADVRFEGCRAAANTTMPSHMSMLTGDLPHQHGVGIGADLTQIERSQTFFAGLPEHHALGLSANPYLRSGFGFDTFFDEFSPLSQYRRFRGAVDVLKHVQNSDASGVDKYIEFLKASFGSEHPLRSLLNGGLVKFDDVLFDSRFPRLLDDGTDLLTGEAVSLAADAPEPLFLFLNLMEAHAPHKNTRGYRDTDVPNTWNSSYLDINDLNANRNIEDHREDVERFREVYAATVQYLDHQVAEMVDRLKEVTGNETTIVITADHGENLGYERDHHLVGHKSSLTESLLHVPCLLINPPEGYDEQETEYFSQRRLGELLVSLAHGETPKLFEQRVGAEALGSERYHADGTPVDR